MEPLPFALEEEVALEGLDGITLETLWFRMSERLKFPLPFKDKFKTSLWNMILINAEYELFEIETPRLTPARLDRVQLYSESSTEEMDNLIAKSYSIYTYHPVDDPVIRGSCQEYSTRKKIDKGSLQQIPLNEIEELYGGKLAVVASQTMRNNVLIPANIGKDCDINNHTYCFLERIGRSRYFGEATSGPNSANSFVKDCKLLHYFRNQLLRNNLVMRQQIQHRIRGKSLQIQLFHLPRFFKMVQVNNMVLTEQLFNFLIARPPNYTALAEEARNHLGLSKKNFRVFLKPKAHIFEYGMMKNKIAFPLNEMKEKDKEKLVNAVKVIDTKFDIFSLYHDEKEEIEEEDAGFLNPSKQMLHTSIVWQVVEKIEQSGGVGMSQAEIGAYFGLSRLNARAIIRRVTKNNDITFYLKDEGRQRTSRYVHKKYKDDKTKKIVDQVAKLVEKAEEASAHPTIQFVPLESSQPQSEIIDKDASVKVSIPLKFFHPEPDDTEIINIIQQVPTDKLLQSSNENSMTSFPEDPYSMMVDEPCTLGNIENVEATMKFLNSLPGVKACKGLASAIAQNKVSEKVLTRMNVILDILKEKSIVDSVQLLNMMRQKELKDCKETICRKSMLALCNQLTADNFLKVIELELKSQSKTVKTLYLGEPHVTLDMRCWHSIIEEQKIQHFLRPIPENKVEPKIEPTISGLSFISKESLGIEEFSAQSIKYHNETFPKFQKYRLFHEFLFYLIYDYPNNNQKIPIEDAVKVWKKDNQNIFDLDEIPMTVSSCYSTDFNWKMFVPPLNPYRGYTNGWGLLRDLIHRVPLILYVKFTRYGAYVPNLKEYLDHPIKCNYLIHFLPNEMRKALLQGRKHVQVFHDLCKRMCLLGLLQIGPNRSKEIDYTYMYLNRNASNLDTTTNSGEYLQMDIKEYDQRRYFFDSAETLSDYWKDLMNICINTPVGKINAPDFPPPSLERCTIKAELIPYLAVQTADTVQQNDLGEIPGDHRGAGGLDTWLAAHARSNWSKEPALRLARKRKIARIKSLESPKKKRRLTKEDENLVKKIIKKRIRKKTIPPGMRKIPTKAERLTGIHSGVISTIIRKAKTEVTKKQKKKPGEDEVDKKALQLLQQGRCMWSDVEDETLLLIKAAMKFIFKSESQCSHYCPSVLIRDILHWRTSKAYDKTTNACKRRILYLMNNKPQSKERVKLYIEELAVTREFSLKYSNFLDKIPDKVKKTKDIFTIVKIHMVELVHRMHQFFLKQFTSATIGDEKFIELPCIYDNFKTFCSIIHVSDGDDFKYKEPANPQQVEIASLSSLIHSGVCCQRDKTSIEYYLYETYKQYSDSHLNEATNVLRKVQVISKKSQQKSRFQLSNRYALQMGSVHIPAELYDEYLEGLKRLSMSEASYQMKIVNCGIIFMLAEMLKNKKIELTLEKAEKLIMVDPSLKNKTNFEEISDNYIAAKKEDQNRKEQRKNKVLQLPNDSSSDVKFYHTEDPIEIFFKFHDFYLHIFCLVSALDKNEILKVDRWHVEEDKCTLKGCIMENLEDNSLGNTLQRISCQSYNTVNEILNMDRYQVENESSLITKKNFVKFFDAKIATFEKENLNNMRKDVSKKVSSGMHHNVSTKMLLSQINQLATENEQEEGAWLSEYKKISIEYPDEIFDEDFEEVDPIKHSSISHQLKDLDVPLRSSDSFVVNLSTIYVDVVGGKSSEILIDGDHYDNRLLNFDENLRNNLTEKIKHRHIWMPEDLEERSLSSEILAIGGEERFTEICEFIIEKGEMGATADEMIDKFGDKKALQSNVDLLLKYKIILRAGFTQVRFIYKSYSSKWLLPTLYLTEDTSSTSDDPSIVLEPENILSDNISKDAEETADVCEPAAKKAKIDDTTEDKTTETTEDEEKEHEEKEQQQPQEEKISKKYIQHPYFVLPAPWIRVGPLNRSINQRCLEKWLGTVLNYLSINPAILLSDLRSKFNVLNEVHLRSLCEILEEIGCVKLMTHDNLEIDVLSEYTGESDTEPATYLDSSDRTFVEVTIDAFQRLTTYIGKHYYKAPFI